MNTNISWSDLYENWNDKLAFQVRRGSSHKSIARARIC